MCGVLAESLQPAIKEQQFSLVSRYQGLAQCQALYAHNLFLRTAA